MIDYDPAARRLPGDGLEEAVGMLEDTELEFELTIAHLHPERRERFELLVQELLHRRRGYGRQRQPPRPAHPESPVESS